MAARQGAIRDQQLLQDFSRPLDLKQVKCGWYESRECDYWVPEADVEGSIPVELYGTLFRNGPGLLEVYGKKLQHREYCYCYSNAVDCVVHVGLELATVTVL